MQTDPYPDPNLTVIYAMKLHAYKISTPSTEIIPIVELNTSKSKCHIYNNIDLKKAPGSFLL